VWEYKTKIISSHADLLSECSDFVYCIYYKSGKKYIGKKTCRSMRRLKPTKKQLEIRKNYKRIEFKDIPFINYVGSSKETENEVVERKEILHQCSSKKTATYIEAAILFEENALFDDSYLNKNISGVFFDNSLDGWLDRD